MWTNRKCGGNIRSANKKVAYPLATSAAIVTSMQSDDLTRDQARALFERVSPMLNYLVRLRKRMVQRHFDGDDQLYQAVCCTGWNAAT
jgi:hypothetical protein